MKILNLSDCPDYLQTVAEWHVREWPECYRGGDIHTAIKELHSSLNRDCLPITLIATVNNELIGSISLLETDLPIMTQLGPWLTTLYVVPTHRGHGVAKALIIEGLQCLRKLGERFAYVWIEKNVAVYQKWGWQLVEMIRYRHKYAFILRGDIAMLPILKEKGCKNNLQKNKY